MRVGIGERQLWWILGLALAVRLAAGVWWQSRLEDGQRFHFPDSESYWELGQTIGSGKPYEFRSPQRKVFRAPGYPLLLAPIFVVAGPDASVFWGRAASAVCGTVAVGGVYWWARRAFDVPTARIAAGLAAVYPGAVAMSGLVLTEAPFTAVMAWQLALWHNQGDRFKSSRQSAAESSLAMDGGESLDLSPLLVGVLGGVATLIRPSWLVFTPLAAGAAVVCGREKKRQLAFAGIALAAMFITLLPWWLRNWRVTGHFVPTTLQVGASLYDGLSPRADGSSDLSHADAFAANKNLSEYELDRTLRAAAIDWAAQNPGEALRLAGVKFLRMWNVWPNEPSFRSWPARIIVAASFVPAIMLAAIGAWRFRDRKWTVAMCLAPAAYFTALHVVFVSSIRYRQPAMLPLIVLAAAASQYVWHSANEHWNLSSAP